MPQWVIRSSCAKGGFLDSLNLMTFLSPYEALVKNAALYPHQTALGTLRLGNDEYENFFELDWSTCLEKVKAYALYLRSLGLKKGDHIAFRSRNQASWLLLDWACSAGGWVSVPLYPQSTIHEVSYILKEAEVKLLVSETIIDQFECNNISVEDLEIRSRALEGQKFISDCLDPELASTIIYTSGTTGKPKGVMHSEYGIYGAMQVANNIIHLSEKDRLISYLPLSHVAERTLSSYGSLYFGCAVYLVDSVEKMAKFLPKVRPTVFFAVPRVWELIRGKLAREMNNSTDKFSMKVLSRLPEFLRRTILGKMIRKRMGFDAARLMVSGAAKLSEETAEMLIGWGLPVIQGYGLTETFCISCMDEVSSSNPASVGRPYPGVELKIAEDGEVCLRAPFHFVGYFKREEETQAAFRDGWFLTGDIGRLDSDFKLIITDRKKDVFKTSNGKYVAPLPIEAQFRAHPGVQEAMVVGDGRPYCVVIVALQDPNLGEESLIELLERVNSNLPSHERIHSLGYFRRAWNVESGELTPTMKLKRRSVLKKYGTQIQSLYDRRVKVEALRDQSDDGEDDGAEWVYISQEQVSRVNFSI
ncbi:MAG: hypothetical protein COV44_09415 [Deltaproteobacteria bacterium CG11_big_fil_rev_8_21_14_0_20_45_16]|nr:MAG: hypothetical protein COV44_09415 [Deltaproteobacteria bacterium CG11_big_fil_rev_8_21_14_0_20_45_16]